MQWFPWIHQTDLAGIIRHALENDSVEGPVNGTSPGVVINRDFTKVLGKVLKRPTIFPVPVLALRVLLGEIATMLVASHRAVPDKIVQLGYEFQYPDLEAALRDCLQVGYASA